MFTLFVCPTPYFGSTRDQEVRKRKRNTLWGIFCSSILCFSIAAVIAIASVFFFGNEKDDTIRHNVDTEETIRAEVKNETVAEMDGDLVKTTEGDSQPVVYQIISSRGRTLIMAKVNTRFCKPSEDSKSLVYAPVVLPPKMGAPSDEDYLAANWYYNSVQPPEPPEGKMVSSVSYYVDGEEVFAEYEYTDAPAPIRTFSKLKLYGALVQANLWDALVGWLQNQTVHGMNAYTAFTLAQDLSDDHPLFQSWYEQIKTDLGVSDEVAEAILEASLAD